METAEREQRLRLLLDSNVVIAAEPFDGVLEDAMPLAARLVQLANRQGHQLCVTPATQDDLLQGRDPVRRRQRLAELEKFQLLEEVVISDDLTSLAGESPAGSNDHRDLRVLAALEAGAADYLVTEDDRLRRRAARAGLRESVFSLSEIVDLLVSFEPRRSQPPPRVSRPASYTLRHEDPIFDGLRSDYEPEFDEWLRRVRRESESRPCYVIVDDGAYAAVAICKWESTCRYPFAQPVMKISTFKVAANRGNLKYGELLLKAVLADAHTEGAGSLYVEVLPRHAVLLEFLRDFGFVDSEERTARGELVMRKELRPTTADLALTDLGFHVRFGPPALLVRQSAFVIPIEPRWHRQLFPELDRAPPDVEQLPLFPWLSEPLTHPWGNAIRKAYLCASNSRQVRPGDLLLFYRSGDRRTVDVVGVVEDVLRSRDGHEIAQFVGRRTVYTPDEISVMCRSVRGVLAIRFRQDRSVEPGWSLAELRLMGALAGAPQSVTRVRQRGMKWLRDQLAEQP